MCTLAHRTMSIRFVSALLLALALCSGCGTIGAHHLSADDDPPRGVYRGVRFDCECIGEGADIYPTPVAILDLPLSFAADTLVLPYDIIDSTRTKKVPTGSDR